MNSHVHHLYQELTERVAGIGSWRVDLVENTLFWSDQVYRIHDVHPETYTPELGSAINFYHPDDRDQVKKYVAEAIENKKSYEFQLRIVRSDDQVRWVHSKGECLLNEDGDVVGIYGIFQDITDRRNEMARYELSVLAARAGVWDWDIPAGTFVTNALFHAMLGEDPARVPLPLDYFLSRLHPDDIENANIAIQSAHSDRHYVYDIEFRFRCKDGSYKWIRSAGQVVEYDAANRPVRMIGQHFDIDNQKKIEEKLRVALNEAKLANQTKSDFLANMSHEIRTPMNGVLGMSELLLETELTEDQVDLAQSVKRSGEALLRVINDILDFSKIEAGKIELCPVRMSIKDLIDDIEKIYQVVARRKKIALSTCLMPDVPAFVFGDPDRLRQILVNLIGNALKFTMAGGSVTISATTEELNDTHAKLLFYISDTGIGIHPDKQKSVFEAFVQADATTTRKFGGTGLGLAISSRLVALMGGRIGLFSEPGKGATFHFSATFALSSCACDPEQIAEEEPSRTMNPLRILVAEDNKINQKVARKFLENAGHRVTVVENGLLAIEAFEDEKFDVVLMDIQMPVMSGEEAALKIKSMHAGGRNTPVVALTANAMKGDREKYIAMGFDEYVSKPIDKGELFAVLAKVAPDEASVGAFV